VHIYIRRLDDINRRQNNRRDRGRLVPQLLGWGTNNWSPNFLAVVFKKQEILQQVVSRMQDLASQFSKIFRGWYPRTLIAGGSYPLPHPSQPGFWPGAQAPRCWDPNIGLPQLFSRGCATCAPDINVQACACDCLVL